MSPLFVPHFGLSSGSVVDPPFLYMGHSYYSHSAYQVREIASWRLQQTLRVCRRNKFVGMSCVLNRQTRGDVEYYIFKEHGMSFVCQQADTW
jgi:hypothetical protein